MSAPPFADPPPVLLYGDPRLRQVCREVPPGEDVSPLVASMRAAMAHHDGVGLAAPQIGDPRRVVVVADPQRPHADPTVLINPSVRHRSAERVAFEEGCLSFPDLFLWLDRPRAVAVSYRDVGGSERVLEDAGLLARIVQHELDHLDGVLFVDHLPAWRRWLLQRRLHGLRRRAAAARRELA